MILDNENKNPKVFEWITQNTENGKMDIVTGYFTIGALAFLAKITRGKVNHYRFMLGDIVHIERYKNQSLNLLNENLSIDNSLLISRLSKEAVEFLALEKVEAKTLEPNFCHAKLYLFIAQNDDRHHYYIYGSSNLTEAGLGQKVTNNVELNIAETGNNTEYKELREWFNLLWVKDKAHKEKTLKDEKGKIRKVPFKQYLIDEISKLFYPYQPEQIYFKILFELFHQADEDPNFKKEFGKLENTRIFEKLYPFQKTGVNSLVKMLNKYNGAILADAVGLGKTWSALAVMKYFQMQGHEVILLCPKKLEQNWAQYYYKNNSLFADDRLDFELRFHTDLRETGLDRGNVSSDFFTNDRPKLFVIDESHNLRNDKSSRYQYLVTQVLQQSKGDIKVLLLSATPINNSFKDVRNQFRLMVKGENTGFADSLDVKNLEHTFRAVQGIFNQWTKEEKSKLSDFYAQIKDSSFFRLTDNLLVARTRKKIQANFGSDLIFPKHLKPINIFITPMRFGDVENFAELMSNLELNLSAYQPSKYTITLDEENALAEKKRKGVKAEKNAILKDDVQREHFLVKMMMILMLKRLESSWFSFHITIGRIYTHHENALIKIADYENTKQEILLTEDSQTQQDISNEDESGKWDKFFLGKKTPISLKTIDNAGRLNEFKTAIKRDKKNLKYILDNLKDFEKKMNKETKLPTQDSKLHKLLDIIAEKQLQSNKKILIFSAYKDTVQYLFDQLQKHGITHFAMVAGDKNEDWLKTISKLHEPILERFAPYTKLFKEKNWRNFSPSSDNLPHQQQYEEWIKWIEKEDSNTYQKIQNPIEILITTDVLSEGQNLQDADCIINYDIHWNPVRVIQRVGRIDRIGSPNAEIQSINFWPAKDIDDYINLKARVEKRMAIMKLAGSEVIEKFTDDFDEMAQEESLEARQHANMLRQMESSLEEIDGEKSLGFDDFSFDYYRQLLQDMLNQQKKAFEDMPNGVFSGFKCEHNENMQQGLIALLRNKTIKDKQNSLSLIYIDWEGNPISTNQKIILEQLTKCYKKERYVPSEIDSGNKESILLLSNALRKWIKSQYLTEVIKEDGTMKETLGTVQLNMLDRLKAGSKEAILAVKTEVKPSETLAYHNFELITWLLIN